MWEEELDRLGAPEGVGSCALGLPDYRSLGTEADLARLLEGAGFRTVAFAASRWTYRPTYDGFMTFMSRHVVSQRFDGLDADRRHACLAAVTARTRGLSPSELGLDADVLYAVASR